MCQLRRFFLCRAAGELSVTRVRLLRLLAVEVVAARLGVAVHREVVVAPETVVVVRRAVADLAAAVGAGLPLL